MARVPGVRHPAHPPSRPRPGRLVSAPLVLAALLATAVSLPTSLPAAADCTLYCDNPSFLSAEESGNVDGDTVGLSRCFFGSLGKYCEVPLLLGVTYTLDDLFCDPHGTTPCDVTAESLWHFRGNGSNACFQGLTINAGWLLDDSFCGLSLTGTLDTDLGTARAHLSATCGTPGDKTLRAIVCQGTPCHREASLPLDISSSALCNPLPAGCGEGDPGAGMCCFGPGGASPPDGAPPGFGPPDTNARFVYQARGVGHPGSPGAATWIADSGLGRYWIHEFATRVVSSTPSTAWLITPGGTFRRFTDSNADGLYDEAAPSDEYRTLERDVPLAGQWTLTDLDGTTTVFRADGSWQSTEDRFGNAWTATYAAGLLDTVTFPDGRREVFSYVGGRLDTIQQQGLEDDGTPADCSAPTECRTWSFTWSGDDLARIDYPDGTAREFFYGDGRFPGYITRRDLVANDGGRRIEAAWEYTAAGRIHRTWKGATAFTDAGAVEKYEFSSYDDEVRPTAVEVTDPYGQAATYEIGYDEVSVKPRLESVTGRCPSCGGPDDRYEYAAPGHPLRPSARIDGNGERTEFTYDPKGTVATRTDAAATAQQRTVEYEYDPVFEGLRTLERWPSVSGTGFRETTWSYDATTGVLDARTISGDEATYDLDGDGTPEGAFSLTTEYRSHNAAGLPGEIDPPGFGTTDIVAFTYDVSGRNGLLADSRTDPVVGTTTFGYDGLNRRTSETDPNGIETVTVHDPLDRVVQVTRAAGTPRARVTTYQHNAFGDLEALIRPRGNRAVYLYDPAGRLETIRRQAGAALAPGDEQTRFTLDGFGQRIREEEQVWDGTEWQTRTATGYDYSSRCYLDRVIHDPDHGGTAVTEYDHDCSGNLTAVWDAEHPSLGGTAPPSQVYVHDALDRLVEVRQPWVPGTECRGATAPADCAVSRYAFDPQDHLVQVVDAKLNVTDYRYSDRDLLTRELSPVSGETLHRYDDHANLVETTDARGVTVRRVVDALDRVTLVDPPDPALDTVHAYDVAPAACAGGPSFPVGRLASITRDGVAVEQCYDELGQRTRDGALTYGFDANGNAETVTYPGGVEATYEYDLVGDRPVALSVTTPAGGGPQPVVSGGTYRPAGPLTGLTFANGTAETRAFDERYFPESITWAGPTVRTWTYGTDAVGNVTSITSPGVCPGDTTLAGQVLSSPATVESCADLVLGPDLTLTATADVTFRAAGGVRLRNGFAVEDGGRMRVETGAAVQPPAELRTFGYDGPYFLTRADGPWGERDWSYDRIGNRLTETRDRSGTSATDVYHYDPNPAGDSTAILRQVQLSPTGSADYDWDAAGNLETLVRGANHLVFTFDDAGRLARLERGDGVSVFDAVDFAYDGRGFLHRATDPSTGATVDAVYDSAGLLHALVETDGPSAPERRHTLFYLAGRPVAQLTQHDGTETWQYLTTDHLGTPLLAADATATVTWSGGFEPFGQDPAAGTAEAALAAEVFLRLPGQWETGLWAGAALGSGGVYYNVWRWYQAGTGRYGKPDPVGITEFDPHPYAYVMANPLRFTDSLGLRRWPFGAGRFCRDDSCRCEPPVQVLGEDSGAFTPIPASGQCVDADAVYSKKCVVKIPDNFKCTLKCDPSAPEGQQGTLDCRPKGLFGGVGLFLLGRKPECFDDPSDIPIGWPPNPFAAGGS